MRYFLVDGVWLLSPRARPAFLSHHLGFSPRPTSSRSQEPCSRVPHSVTWHHLVYTTHLTRGPLTAVQSWSLGAPFSSDESAVRGGTRVEWERVSGRATWWQVKTTILENNRMPDVTDHFSVLVAFCIPNRPCA